MKNKTILIAIFLLSFSYLNAKHVKFAVDMSGVDSVSINGVHIAGDFQTLAGFSGGDWSPNSTILTNEPGTSIYSIVVDIPANTKYEFKFINGDSWYSVEFVPEESRVGYDFNDNRWIWVDSLSIDTFFVGVIPFSGNSSDGINLLRFVVNMQNQTVSEDGVYLNGDFTYLGLSRFQLYSFDGINYERILYLPSDYYEYLYLNGATYEIVPNDCSNNSYRYISVDTDLVISKVCFSSCSDCNSLIIENNISKCSVYPNPTSDFININLLDNSFIHTIEIFNIKGEKIYFDFQTTENNTTINVNDFNSGLYLIRIYNSLNQYFNFKIEIQ